MLAAYQWQLAETERAQREQARARDPKPFVRERAAALLAIAGGASIRQAARTAGLRPHQAATLCAWVARYQAEGLAGLRIRTGRGRKPASFPAAG